MSWHALQASAPDTRSMCRVARTQPVSQKEKALKKIFLLFVCLTISVVSFGQDKAASSTTAAEIPPGPSMKETAAWIKRELPLLGAYSTVSVKNDDRSKPITCQYGVQSAVLSDGRLSIRRTEFSGRSENDLDLRLT